jgi:dihydroorotate dehydrogenase (NAD+) catalytic subunit
VKARKRVVTTPGVRRSGTKRTPTVRRIKPAIEPVVRARAAPAAVASPAEHTRASVTESVDLSVDLGRGLVLPNAIVAASGTFGYGVEHGEAVDVARLGGICTRGTTLKARNGNPPPRIGEAPAGLLNAVGLHNPGIDTVLDRYAATWARWPVPVVLNLCGESVGEYVELVRRLEGAPGVAGVELNLSCPNGPRGGTLFGLDPELAGSLASAVRRATDLPVIAKLTPNAPDPRAIAVAVEDAGADAISAVNTLTAVGLRLGIPYAGLSGPALKPVALRVVFEIAQAVEVPIIGIGGVTSLEDVIDLLAVGASAVGVGTASFADPSLGVRLVDVLAAECRSRGLTSHRALIGTALPRRPATPSSRGAEYRP